MARKDPYDPEEGIIDLFDIVDDPEASPEPEPRGALHDDGGQALPGQPEAADPETPPGEESERVVSRYPFENSDDFLEEIEKTPLMTLLPPKGEVSALPEEPVSDGAVHASWLSPIIAIALAFGVLAGVLTWVAGPSKGIFAVGKAGYMPPFFQKTNKLGVQKNILFVQGLAVTVLSLLFVVMPSVQSFYQILSQLTVILYLIMYLLMFSGAIALRYKMKKLNRPFRIGKSGNGLMWFVGGLGFCGSLLAFILSFIPPSQISTGSNTVWFSVLIIGAIIVVVAPFIIYASKKPSWVDPNSNFEPFHWEVQAQPATASPSVTKPSTTASGPSSSNSSAPSSGSSASTSTSLGSGDKDKDTPKS